MNTSNKTLLQILTEELPKNGGWPEGVEAMAQDADGAVQNYSDTRDIRINDEFAYGSSRIACSYSIESGECEVSTDRLTAIITREQYEAALAASKELLTGTGVDGWIDWAGGECPVEEGTLVDVRYRDGEELSALPANDLAKSHRDASHAFWRNDGNQNDIIAYRLHKPQEAEQAKADDEADLNDYIGQQQEDLDALRTKMVGDIYLATGSITLNDAFNIAHGLIDAGYRKQ